MNTYDTWNGKPLPVRRQAITPEIHYRIHDQTGQLLSFNSTNSLDMLAADVLHTQRAHPTARLRITTYDGPAY
ncbi:hypothetical protein QNO07_09410 [Streptomyces sp. 549]|uniref:hypothetical protein n=1 Tax=Streptomyces sp. 549 TaxID=3049076 RepID=UPI0024C2830B|nr:hypothetical protein [Streptomyces sp. 549]MDK1473636.1 hypothetical protein [Streptomyces sp. 549]